MDPLLEPVRVMRTEPRHVAGCWGMVVTRWRRYGKDRIYVKDDESGADVGWWDLVTDEAHPATPDLHSALADAVTRWRGGAVQCAGGPRSGPCPHGSHPGGVGSTNGRGA